MEEATAAACMQSAAGPGGRAAATQTAAHVTRPAGPPRTPSPRTALSPRVRVDRGRRGRVSQPPPLGAAEATPWAGATRARARAT
eukprot:6779057-Prymnesium_polylepis.1